MSAFLSTHQVISSPINKSLAVSLGISVLTSFFLLYRLAAVSSIPVAQAQVAEVLPTGTVIPFNLSSCPSGWSEYTSARGRAIIGTNPTAGGGISVRTLGQTGGEETHTLTTNEMPSHNHTGMSTDPVGVANALFYTGGAIAGSSWGALASNTGVRWGVGALAPAGGGAAHNTMPPFIALLYCQKN